MMWETSCSVFRCVVVFPEAVCRPGWGKPRDSEGFDLKPHVLYCCLHRQLQDPTTLMKKPRFWRADKLFFWMSPLSTRDTILQVCSNLQLSGEKRQNVRFFWTVVWRWRLGRELWLDHEPTDENFFGIQASRGTIFFSSSGCLVRRLENIVYPGSSGSDQK